MGADFTSAWLRIATGEKDPRNLMIAFAIYRVVLIEFPINDHIDVSG
jgi:DNA repair/transcription protein MET18/MMS19